MTMTAHDFIIPAADKMAAPGKLPVLATVLDSFNDLTENWTAVTRILASWGALFAVVGTGAFAMIVGAQATLATSPWTTLAAVYLPFLVFMLFFVSAAVGWLRLLLLGEQPTPVYLRFDRQVWRYLGASALMSLALVAAMLLLSAPAVVILALASGFDPAQWGFFTYTVLAITGVVVYGVMLLVPARMYLVMSAKAVDQKMSLRDALTVTKGNSWRLLGGYLLVCVPMTLPLAVQPLFLDFQVRMPGGDLNWLGILGYLALTGVALAAMAVLYLAIISYFARTYRFFAARNQQMTVA